MNENPIITIGIPVFNGEKFLAEKINSLLKQNISKYEIIISDNASIDKTREICEKFAEEYSEIRYIRLNENIGPVKNFKNILDNAKGEFIMFSAVDDKILPGFIEKNLSELRNSKIVCSASQVEYYGKKTETMKKKLEKSTKTKIIKKFSPLKNISTNGTYENKIRKYLKARGHHHIFYGIFRTKTMKEIFVSEIISGFDWATLLNGLKIGNYNVSNEVLMLRYDGGYSSKGFFSYKKSLSLGFIQALFHYVPFTKWCFRNLGIKLCIKNLDLFVILNSEGVFYLGVDILRKIGILKNS